MFVRTKTIDGKKRRYLVESFRNEEGEPRQRHICYVDLWPEKDIARLVTMIKEQRKHLANGENPANTKVYRQKARSLAITQYSKIEKFKQAMDAKVGWDRAKADKRRINTTTGVRHQQNAREPINPFNSFIVTAATVQKWLRQLEPADAPVESYYSTCEVETLEKIKAAIKPIAERFALVERILKEKGE